MDGWIDFTNPRQGSIQDLSFVWMIFPIWLLIYCNDNNISWGEASTPQIP